MNGFPIKKIGSQGQQKTFDGFLKLAQFDFMKSALGYKPMLLLDDVFDKLDDNRVEQLMTLVDQHHFGQIFITDTHPEKSVHIFNKIKLVAKCFTSKKELLKRKSNEQSLGEVIQDYLRESGWQQKLDEIEIITEWDKVLGPTLAKYDEGF